MQTSTELAHAEDYRTRHGDPHRRESAHHGCCDPYCHFCVPNWRELQAIADRVNADILQKRIADELLWVRAEIAREM